MDANNVTADTFSNTSNTQREDANAIFTSVKLDKSDELVDTLKDLTINDAEYYVSNSATANDAKGDSSSDPKTVTYTSDGKGKVRDTSNGKFQQTLLSNHTLPAVYLAMNPRIDDRIATIGGASETLSKLARKEFVTDAECGSAWIDRTIKQVIRTGPNRSTPCDTGMDVRSKPAPSPVMIGSTTIYLACGLSGRLQVGKKFQSTSPDEVSNAQKMNTVVDGKFPKDQDYASVFS